MTARRDLRSDAGQAFPLYITAVAGLLFLALALFAVGQAGATRNGGQTAADAAALAAGQDYRDRLRAELLKAIVDGGAWDDLLNGRGLGAGNACEQAGWFAGKNDAEVTGCTPGYLPTSFTVTVRTREPVGDTVIPGTERQYAKARAKAVVSPRCAVSPMPSPTPTSEPPADDDEGDDGDEGGEGGDGHGEDGENGEEDKPAVDLRCDGADLTIDPAHPDLFPDAKDLFSVHLAD
ncbi:pilus assembly protein TadG-related protein [Streptomyces cucumeris]|uniref:pilus assembly protein TadG-related protein n=1 Tax=Streptomyces cucumeris TaxID=2962890 RepID=UPI003D71F5A2